MTAIHAICVPAHEERADPKPHILYRIEIQAHPRSWRILRRYSEFVELHAELIKSTGHPPPEPLPPKRVLTALCGLFKDSGAIIEERHAGLETYLRAIISAKDDKWRKCDAFNEFLDVPAGHQGSVGEGNDWTQECLELQSRISDITADLSKRKALSDTGDVSMSHTINVQAKKKLADTRSRVQALSESLEHLGKAAIGEGELQRRTDLVAVLQSHCNLLDTMVTQSSRPATSSSIQGSKNVAVVRGSNQDARLGKPVTRVFGAGRPSETDATRPLDDQGLIQLHRAQMEQQDAQVATITSMLRAQRHLGEAINCELAVQNELLDGLSSDVDRVGGKIVSAKKQLNRLR